MKKNKNMGILLILSSLMIILAMILNNIYLWFYVDFLVIIISGIIGIILLLRKE